MKNLILPFIAVFLFSCSKTEETPIPIPKKTQSELILGKWEFNKYEHKTNGIITTQPYNGNSTDCSKEFFTALI